MPVTVPAAISQCSSCHTFPQCCSALCPCVAQDLTRALVQKIEHDVARQATSNDVNLRVVAMPSSQDSKKPAGGSGAAKAGVAAAKKKKS